MLVLMHHNQTKTSVVDDLDVFERQSELEYSGVHAGMTTGGLIPFYLRFDSRQKH